MEKYGQLEKVSGEDQDTFEMTAAAMREEGVSLRTLDEIKQVGESHTFATWWHWFHRCQHYRFRAGNPAFPSAVSLSVKTSRARISH